MHFAGPRRAALALRYALATAGIAVAAFARDLLRALLAVASAIATAAAVVVSLPARPFGAAARAAERTRSGALRRMVSTGAIPASALVRAPRPARAATRAPGRAERLAASPYVVVASAFVIILGLMTGLIALALANGK